MFKKFKIHTSFEMPFRMKTLISLGKDVLNRFQKSGVVYKLICRKCKVTYVRQIDRLLNTSVEEHKKNFVRKCDYNNVLSDHRKEYADHYFDWNNVEILLHLNKRTYNCTYKRTYKITSKGTYQSTHKSPYKRKCQIEIRKDVLLYVVLYVLLYDVLYALLYGVIFYFKKNFQRSLFFQFRVSSIRCFI